MTPLERKQRAAEQLFDACKFAERVFRQGIKSSVVEELDALQALRAAIAAATEERE